MTEPPLAGLRVLDLTQALSGPFGSMLLADMGADVIKIESPKGDLTRTTPPHYVAGQSVYFLSLNRNKTGVVIDLKRPAGLDLFYELVGKADIVFHNFSPEVPKRLKIDHASLKRINPRIISCQISGFGTRGPAAHRKAVDVIIQAVAGGMSITGLPGSAPVRAGIPTADLAAGLFAIIGILAAVHSRERTGQGMEVQTSLFQAQLSLLSYVAAYALHSKEAPQPMGSGHLGTVPSQAFATRDGYIVVDAGFDHLFTQLCDAMNLPGVKTDARFTLRQGRMEHRHILIPLLENRFREETTDYWVDRLDAAGIPGGPVNDVLEALASPQSTEYSMVRTMDFKGQKVEVLGSPIEFDGVTDHPVTTAPSLGAHTEKVLRELLGYSRSRIEELLAEGVVKSSA